VVSNRLTRLKGRLSSVIDWRVREAYADERKIVADLAESTGRFSTAFADQINELSRTVELLEARVRELEGRSGSR
jgi:ubiquinone biosynthesis protein UbiJ